jgi:type VI secretion system protein VasI
MRRVAINLAAIVACTYLNASPAVADHAADVAKCNAIGDASKRSECLSLISPGGQPIQPSAQAGQPEGSSLGQDVCKNPGDFSTLVNCLAGEKAEPVPVTSNGTEEYFAAITRCGTIQGQLVLRQQCLHNVGQPPASVEIPRSTYDEKYQEAINACVANRYSIDAEACELEALMQAMQRQRRPPTTAKSQPSAKPKSVQGQGAPKPQPPKRATADEVADMMVKLGHGPGLWNIRHERSPITDTENVYLRVASQEIIPASYGTGEPAYLFLRCRDDQTDVMFTMAGHWFYDEHSVTSRIDRKSAVTHRWYQSSDNEVAFHPAPIPFIKELISAKQVIVQTAPISSPIYLATFDLTGIAEVVKPLRASCGW